MSGEAPADKKPPPAAEKKDPFFVPKMIFGLSLALGIGGMIIGMGGPGLAEYGLGLKSFWQSVSNMVITVAAIGAIASFGLAANAKKSGS